MEIYEIIKLYEVIYGPFMCFWQYFQFMLNESFNGVISRRRHPFVEEQVVLSGCCDGERDKIAIVVHKFCGRGFESPQNHSISFIFEQTE